VLHTIRCRRFRDGTCFQGIAEPRVIWKQPRSRTCRHTQPAPARPPLARQREALRARELRRLEPCQHCTHRTGSRFGAGAGQAKTHLLLTLILQDQTFLRPSPLRTPRISIALPPPMECSLMRPMLFSRSRGRAGSPRWDCRLDLRHAKSPARRAHILQAKLRELVAPFLGDRQYLGGRTGARQGKRIRGRGNECNHEAGGSEHPDTVNFLATVERYGQSRSRDLPEQVHGHFITSLWLDQLRRKER
jgi:hypothetical protein